MAAQPQNFNFQTYYTDTEIKLDNDLQNYVTIDGTPDEYKKPNIFKDLYQLAWDYFALQQDTGHNVEVYTAYAAVAANAANVPPPGDRRPAVINTVIKFGQAIELYCRNMGMVIGAKILRTDNLDEVMDWVKDNGVFQATLPIAGVNFQPRPVVPPAVAGQHSGATAIYLYAENVCLAEFASRRDLDTSIRRRLLLLLDAYSKTFFEGGQNGRECAFFQAQMAPFNAGGLDNANTIAAYATADGNYVGNADTGERFNGSMFLKNLLLNMTRNTVVTRQTYNHVKTLLNTTPISLSLFKEIESNVGIFDKQIANVGPVQASERTTSIFTGVGYNSPLDRLKTDMPRRLTHRCLGQCNAIYSATPIVRCMSYNRKVYVAPIQTRGNDVDVIVPSTVANNMINTFGATAIVSPAAAGLAPDLPLQAVFTPAPAGAAVGTMGTIDVLRTNAMPGPNPQPLTKNKAHIYSTDYPSDCTIGWDLDNMRMLTVRAVSVSNTKGHGDWQSMPNYATCWLIKHNDKNVNPKTTGVKMTTQDASTIEVFPFERKWPFSLASTGSKFTIPKDNDNCMLPTHWEMFALWPTGKLIYRNMSNKEFTIDPPLGSYWKEWRGADYGPSYMAEIGYQEAKAEYDARPAREKVLTVAQQIELFQMGAHKKMEEYINTIRRGDGVGGSGNNNKKRYNKKTVMSMLKTAKRKYFTRRNNKKRNLY